ncbi:MAG TPA: hypothetical protein VN877_00140, partial [Opitutaceae bacterium]|nr:hypothetical protein [Opitutaceae bacterium]
IPADMLPDYDFKFGPYEADACGQWCTPNAITKFTSTLLNVPPNGTAAYQWVIQPSSGLVPQFVGAPPNGAASHTDPVCYIQMPSAVTDFTLGLVVTFYAKAGNNPAAKIQKQLNIQMVLPAAVRLCTLLRNMRYIPQPIVIGDPAMVDQGRDAVQLPVEELVGLQGLAQQYASAGASLAAAAEESLRALREWKLKKKPGNGSRSGSSPSKKKK